MKWATRVATGSAALVLLASPVIDEAAAEDYYNKVPFLPTVKIENGGSGATPSTEVYGKEYSHNNYSAAAGREDIVSLGDHDAGANPDPLQVVSWDGLAGPLGGNSGSVDGFDYGRVSWQYENGQVDALANHQDLLLPQVVDNSATLLFSVTADTDTAGLAKAHVHFEDPDPVDASDPLDIWAQYEAPPTGPGVNHHPVSDLDALEVWGPEPPSHTDLDSEVVEGYVGGGPGTGTPTSDADRFSLDNDYFNGQTSVFAYIPSTGVSVPWIHHDVIVAAVEELFLEPGQRFDDETRRKIDVDGTMTRDSGDSSPTAPLWDINDQLLFTIDPIEDIVVLGVTGGPVASNVVIDGGEIMHLLVDAAGATASFLNHGGHLWDTAFDVRTRFGYDHEDVDALEAVGVLTGDTEIPTPEPAGLALACLLLAAAATRRW